MRRAMLLVACAGCGFGSPGTSSDEGDEGSPTDRDGDGIANDVDLCPDDADPMQRDHDGDRRGDACDGCPHLSSDGDPDQDGDGVGDACDPRPETVGDARLLWIGFHPEDAARIADPAQWRQVGTWTITDGWVGVTAVDIDVLRALTTAQRAVVATRMRLEDISSSNPVAAGIVSGLVGAGDTLSQFYQCIVFRPQNINARGFADGTSQGNNSLSWAGTVASGAVIDLVTRFTGMYECTVASPMLTVRANQGTTAGEFEFVVQNARVSYDYMFVVEPGT